MNTDTLDLYNFEIDTSVLDDLLKIDLDSLDLDLNSLEPLEIDLY